VKLAELSCFTLLYRPEATGQDRVELLTGQMSTPEKLADIPLSGKKGYEALVIVPFRQITERGFACVDDHEPLLVMTVTEQAVMPKSQLWQAIEQTPIESVGGGFDVEDQEYAETVSNIIAGEIGNGSGSNFVIKRSYLAQIVDYSPLTALNMFRRLCQGESGAYWTFVIHTGDRTFVGATPERHVSLRDGLAVMNPISGTYRYPPTGPTLAGLMEFLNDGKERDELHMVVDEELKMMARICEAGGQVLGPHLREMARLAHTEYFIEGRSRLDPREILRETMFAPTVTGSPLESACRVIKRNEPSRRGYYGGVAALIGRDEAGEPAMDSALLIRTADFDRDGRMKISVGATLVRHSDPMSEAVETRVKASALLASLDGAALPEQHVAHPTPAHFGAIPEVQAALARRNARLAGFWRVDKQPRPRPTSVLAGRRVLIVDAEDAFTDMIAHQLRSLGLDVSVRRFDTPYTTHDHDLVVMGPGPGNPGDVDHPRIAHLYASIATLLAERCPFIAVCLSHQVLSRLLGLPLRRCDSSNQGNQRQIDLFGERELVGFYNTFAAWSHDDKLDHRVAGPVEISRDVLTGEVHAFRGSYFSSMQFHPESVLTRDGPAIFATRIREVLSADRALPVRCRAVPREPLECRQ
jgi:2-amino-4-deoxychorismate synthase